MANSIKPHIQLAKSERFQRVLVCGSPERAEKISKQLQGAERLAQNREYHSYIGTYNGQEILVTSHGVGAAGATICFQELMDVGAKAIIRLGTAGGLYDGCRPGDMVVPTAAVRNDGVSPRMVPLAYPAVPDLDVTQSLLSSLREIGAPVRHGIVVTGDLFYPSLLGHELELFKRANAIAAEMECAALFVTGALRQVKTASVLVVDGNPLEWEHGNYDPQAQRLHASIDQAIIASLETLAGIPL